MGKVIDARGKACPMPVVLAKQQMDAGEDTFTIQVDNTVAVQNLQRLADSQGFRTTVEGSGAEYVIAFHRAPGATAPAQGAAAAANPAAPAARAEDWALYIARETMGEGDPELGRNLARMCLYALTQSTHLPRWILCLNGGVKLATVDEQAAGHLRELAEKGVEVLVCGTCLNYYGLTEQLKAGRVSNLYELLEKLQQAGKVVSL